MTTTTQTHTVAYDAANETWDVVDHDGDVMDSFATKAEALKDAAERDREQEATDLQEEIEGALYDGLGLDTLRRMAALIRGR